MDPELTDKEAFVVSQLPNDAAGIAQRSEAGPSAIKHRISSIRDKYEDDEIIEWVPRAGEYKWNGDSEVKKNLSSYHMGTITKRANNWLSREEDRLRHELEKVEIPDKPPDPDPSNEDVVLAISDLHFGDMVEDLSDGIKHNTDLVEMYVDHAFDKAFELIERQRQGGVEIDTLHVNLNGDIVTNENIYEGHFEVLDAFLDEQKDRSVECLEQNLLRAAGQFERVQVNCQVGNHGDDRASGSTKQANADLHVYRELAKRFATRRDELRDLLERAPDEAETGWIEESLECYESFSFNFNNAKLMTKVQLRGGEWEGLLTHGQDMYEQISGTAASDNNVKSLMLDRETQFDIAWCGHYHSARKVNVMGRPIMRTASPKPPDGWAKAKTGAGQAPNTVHRIATLHGVSDDRPCTFYYEIDGSGVDV